MADRGTDGSPLKRTVDSEGDQVESFTDRSPKRQRRNETDETSMKTTSEVVAVVNPSHSRDDPPPASGPLSTSRHSKGSRGRGSRGRGSGRSGGWQRGDKEEWKDRRSRVVETETRRPRGPKGGAAEDNDDEDNKVEGARGPKRKFALLMGYAGTGYSGMQLNSNAKTIEGELWKALVESGCVSKHNADDPKKVAFMRAARTDKGVHALGQVVSLKLIIGGSKSAEENSKLGEGNPSTQHTGQSSSNEAGGEPSSSVSTVAITDKESQKSQERALATETMTAINSKLPDQIRVWGVSRVLGAFHAKNSCDSRIYEYIMPTYVLMEPHHGYYPDSLAAAERSAGTDPDALFPFPDPSNLPSSAHADSPDARFKMYDIPKSTTEQLEAKRRWRLPGRMLESLREVLAAYKGAHNFHNYTIGKKFEEKNSKRYILSFDCSDPYVRNGVEWVGLKVWGNSFMLHQIRKMVGLAVLMVRTKTPISLVSRSYTPVKLNIPKAPACGLFLNQVVYKSYNERSANTPLQPNQSNAERQPITFDPYLEEIEKFKEKWVIGELLKEERDNNVFDEWLRIVDAHSTEYQYFLQRDGTIKEEDKPPYFVTGNALNTFDRTGEVISGAGEEVDDGDGDDDS